jgi:hypothetical protein
MSKPIAIFYHAVFMLPDRPLPHAATVVHGQIVKLADSGLLDACDELYVGVNGGAESCENVHRYIPTKARVVYHGLNSRAENLTLVMIENWVKTHPGWNVLYFHAKSATHSPATDYGRFANGWRDGMMADLVTNWKQCVADLEQHEVCCSHFMRGMGWDKSQHIAAGNFWWATSDFLATLPSIFLRERIKKDGIAALSSRYEAEVWLGNGKMPLVKEYRPNGGGGVP